MHEEIQEVQEDEEEVWRHVQEGQEGVQEENGYALGVSSSLKS
jgi:hypothetical protein